MRVLFFVSLALFVISVDLLVRTASGTDIGDFGSIWIVVNTLVFLVFAFIMRKGDTAGAALAGIVGVCTLVVSLIHDDVEKIGLSLITLGWFLIGVFLLKKPVKRPPEL